MKVTLCGTRGSVAAPGPDTARYGGNTSCVEVLGTDGTLIALDAGTGIRRMSASMHPLLRRVDLLLTHLHMDHIQGLGFFSPIYNPRVEVHIWGPASTTVSLRTRLSRYLSPPLFPVRLRDLPCKLFLHEVANDTFTIGEFTLTAALVCHPGPTVGYRIANTQAALAYLPDHEPALGLPKFLLSKEWTSGYDLAAGVDLLIHDAQYSSEEYPHHVGWGHSSLRQTFEFASLAEAKQLVPFHHDPAHNDNFLDLMLADTVNSVRPLFIVTPGTEGTSFEF